ncbi:MAG TPA: hypothetical protein VNE39_19365 [Planctomycetota bacterium]|nr:hypothetical protein [Planctomycetota bacterium]
MRVCVVVNGLGEERAALASYVLRTLLGTMGLSLSPRRADGLLVSYGCPIPADGAGVEIACGDPPTPEEAIQVHRRVTSEGPSLLVAEGPRVRVTADLVGAAGLWLAGGEERAEGFDAFGRACGAASPRAAAGLLRTPMVHDLMSLLCAALSRAAEAAGLSLSRVPAWPEGRKFAVLLSHDVDLWRKRTARQLAKETVKSLARPWRLPGVARAFCCGPDPWSDLDAIADLEGRYGMHSTFFALPGRPNRVVDGVGVVNSYGARAGAVGEALRRLVARGWEVGLHGSFDSYRSTEALAGERRDVAALLGVTSSFATSRQVRNEDVTLVTGCRQHFLRFERPVTWRAQAEAGLRYDATLGYHDTDGYRAGFSFPFRPFAGEELLLLELPLAVMDGALLERQGLDAEAAWGLVEGYLKRTEADGAMLGLLWHNNYFCDLDAPGYRGVYERALGWTRDHGGWGASAREIAEWWERRAALLQEG